MDLLDAVDISPSAKLALGHAAPGDASAFRSLFLLEHRLERAVREASEPIVAQLKLAWWRDRFAEDPVAWPKGEPLLEQLAVWGGQATDLGPLVDGWEVLTGEGPLSPADIEGFRDGRKAAWNALARAVEVKLSASEKEALGEAARVSALADLQERGIDLGRASQVPVRLERLPRRLRPFSLLGALGLRAVSKKRPLLDGLPALALALRHGLIGR